MSATIDGLELPTAWSTSQSNDSNFDISANELNGIPSGAPTDFSPRTMSVRAALVDWKATLHTNSLDPVDAQDLATKNYVDINGGALWSTFDATESVDMASNFIINLLDPVNPQDGATMAYVDANSATELQELTDVENPLAPVNGDFLRFNTALGIAGLWEAVPQSIVTASSISDGNSTVAVVDSGTGVVNFTLDGILVSTLQGIGWDNQVPMAMNNQKITGLGTPTATADAATMGYVDGEIAGLVIPSVLDDLTDVTIVTPLINQILVNDGAGQWVNQILGKAQLPTEIAYEDETNSFSLTQLFPAGMQLGTDVQLDMQGGFINDIKYETFQEQIVDPADPTTSEIRLFMDDGTDFGETDPILAILVDRGGVITKKPIISSETILALTDFSNGMFTDETGTELADPAVADTMRVQIFRESNRALDFQVVLEGEIFNIQSPDTALGTDNSRNISVGTDIAPVKHFVFIELQLGVPFMNSNTTGFPTGNDFAVVGTFTLQSKVSVLADGAYAVNSPDYEIFDDATRGHLSHINDRLVELDAVYVDGIALTPVPNVGGGTAANITFSSTTGTSFELHREDIEAFDSTLATSINLVTNEGTQQPEELTRIANIGQDLVGLTCADGITIIGAAPSEAINIVLFTIHNDDEPNQTNYGTTLPTTVYTGGSRVADAIADINNTAVTVLPNNIRGLVLLIARLTIDITTTGTVFEVVGFTDLRGVSPSTSGGGTGGGGGATNLNELTDVTIGTIPTATGQILELQSNSQWENVPNPAGLLVADNIWTGFQDYTEQTIPANPLATDARFYVKRTDVNNQGLFVKLEQAGSIVEIQIV